MPGTVAAICPLLGGAKVPGRWPYDGGCSEFEDIEGCKQLKLHVWGGRWCCLMPFL